MRIGRYLALVATATAIAIATVHQHVTQTRLGYEIRALEKEIERLREARRAALLERENAASTERLIVHARELKIANDSELKALVTPVSPAPSKGSTR